MLDQKIRTYVCDGNIKVSSVLSIKLFQFWVQISLWTLHSSLLIFDGGQLKVSEGLLHIASCLML